MVADQGVGSHSRVYPSPCRAEPSDPRQNWLIQVAFYLHTALATSASAGDRADPSQHSSMPWMEASASTACATGAAQRCLERDSRGNRFLIDLNQKGLNPPNSLNPPRGWTRFPAVWSVRTVLQQLLLAEAARRGHELRRQLPIANGKYNLQARVESRPFWSAPPREASLAAPIPLRRCSRRAMATSTGSRGAAKRLRQMETCQGPRSGQTVVRFTFWAARGNRMNARLLRRFTATEK